jgi:hypothetical protein
MADSNERKGGFDKSALAKIVRSKTEKQAPRQWSRVAGSGTFNERKLTQEQQKACQLHQVTWKCTGEIKSSTKKCHEKRNDTRGGKQYCIYHRKEL